MENRTMVGCALALLGLMVGCGSSNGAGGGSGAAGTDGSAGGAGSAGTPGAPGPAGPAGPGGTSGAGASDMLDVTSAGCTPNAIANDGMDDAPAFACALDKLKTKGGTLHVPAGTFDIAATLVVPTHVKLEGSGFASVLAQKHALLGPVLRMQRESILRDVMLTQEHPAPAPGWAPFADYDFQVKVEGDQVTIEDVKLLSPLLGILVSPADPNGAVGQIQIFNVRGQPLEEGIRIDHALDVIHVQQLHFWPFWSSDPAVVSWTFANGAGISSLRDDNPLFSELFFFGYGTGVHLGKSTVGVTAGITSKPKIMQMDCDACGIGVHVDGQGTRGVLLSQLSTQGVNGEFGIGAAGVGVQVDASDASLTLDQGDFALLAGNAIRVTGANVFVSVTGTLVREWNTSAKGFPAFELVGGAGGNAGTTVLVSDSATGNGHGAVPASPEIVLTNVRTGVNL